MSDRFPNLGFVQQMEADAQAQPAPAANPFGGLLAALAKRLEGPMQLHQQAAADQSALGANVASEVGEHWSDPAFQAWISPFTDNLSRAIGGAIAGENPFAGGTPTHDAPFVSEALIDRGVNEYLATMAEFLVPDPTGARKATDLIPVISAGIAAFPFGRLTRRANPQLHKRLAERVQELAAGSPPGGVQGALDDLVDAYGHRAVRIGDSIRLTDDAGGNLNATIRSHSALGDYVHIEGLAQGGKSAPGSSIFADAAALVETLDANGVVATTFPAAFGRQQIGTDGLRTMYNGMNMEYSSGGNMLRFPIAVGDDAARQLEDAVRIQRKEDMDGWVSVMQGINVPVYVRDLPTIPGPDHGPVMGAFGVADDGSGLVLFTQSGQQLRLPLRDGLGADAVEAWGIVRAHADATGASPAAVAAQARAALRGAQYNGTEPVAALVATGFPPDAAARFEEIARRGQARGVQFGALPLQLPSPQEVEAAVRADAAALGRTLPVNPGGHPESRYVSVQRPGSHPELRYASAPPDRAPLNSDSSLVEMAEEFERWGMEDAHFSWTLWESPEEVLRVMGDEYPNLSHRNLLDGFEEVLIRAVAEGDLTRAEADAALVMLQGAPVPAPRAPTPGGAAERWGERVPGEPRPAPPGPAGALRGSGDLPDIAPGSGHVEHAAAFRGVYSDPRALPHDLVGDPDGVEVMMRTIYPELSDEQRLAAYATALAEAQISGDISPDEHISALTELYHRLHPNGRGRDGTISPGRTLFSSENPPYRSGQ